MDMLKTMATILTLAAMSAAIAGPEAHSPAGDGGGFARTTAAEFLSGAMDGRHVAMEATIADALDDETNPNFLFLVLEADGNTIYAPVKCPQESRRAAAALVGARVLAKGFCDSFVPDQRRQMGRQLFMESPDDMEVLSPAPEDPFDVPELGDTTLMTPAEISRLGRHRVAGRVLASWNGTELLLSSPSGKLSLISLSSPPAPEAGAFIEAAGRPASDVYRVNLERATWRPAARFPFDERPAVHVSAHEIASAASDIIHVEPSFFGRTVTIRGTVVGAGVGTLHIDDGTSIVRVVSPGFSINAMPGCVVEATGACILDIENWRPSAAFPQIRGFFLAMRRPDDLRVVALPPWWTTGRLVAVIALLAAAVAAALAWNAALRALAERRGRALMKARIAGERSALKVAERTRLAAELHDSLSQNLAGVAMGVGAARKALPADPTCAASRLEFASRAIDACREGLKQCIWNLRSDILDERDFAKALGRAIGAAADGAELNVEAGVPRARLSDSLANAALRIARELVSNAVRHGGATKVDVRAAIMGGALELQVKDNGRGFDPATAPGLRDGHFGIQGMKELAESLSGALLVESAPGSGCLARATLPLECNPGGDAE